MADENLPDLKFGGEWLIPERDSYRPGPHYGARISDIGGGLPRIARGFVQGASLINVSYLLRDPCQLQWFLDFYYGLTQEGSIPFNCQLALASYQTEEHVAYMLEAPRFEEFPGYYGRVSLSLSALPFFDPCVQQLRAELASCMGGDMGNVIREITNLATVEFPKSLGRI